MRRNEIELIGTFFLQEGWGAWSWRSEAQNCGDFLLPKFWTARVQSQRAAVGAGMTRDRGGSAGRWLCEWPAVYRADMSLPTGPGLCSFSASAPVSNLHAPHVALDLWVLEESDAGEVFRHTQEKTWLLLLLPWAPSSREILADDVIILSLSLSLSLPSPSVCLSVCLSHTERHTPCTVASFPSITRRPHVPSYGGRKPLEVHWAN